MKPGARVLLVDTNPAAIESMHAHLAALGCAVSVAHDGAAGLASARRERPDVAVVDALLPEVNGYALCRELKRLDRPPAVLMLAARAADEDRFWAAECGVDLFVSRPVEDESLAASVAGLIEAR